LKQTFLNNIENDLAARRAASGKSGQTAA